MKLKTPIIGGVAVSLQGRDKGCFYLIIKVENGFAYLCNGKEKPLNSLKRKNVKHLSLLPAVEKEIAERLANGKKVYDYEIATVLKKYRKP
ncbi:MAG: KOW domain-containing RNA-binding protein [Clostridia bacterium]|nr:KOW domain-containing RNA-binding protein [Clostridia bacterium]